MSSNRSVQAAKRRAEGGIAPKPSSKPIHGRQPQQPQPSQSQSLSSVNKMTITQAITLITLRLSSVETKILEMGGGASGGSGGGEGSVSHFDSELLKSILERLDYLENQSAPYNAEEQTDDSALQMKLALLEQKIDVIAKKGGVGGGQTKSQMDELKTEMKQVKSLLQTLQGVAFENSQKILELTMAMPCITEEEDPTEDSTLDVLNDA